MLTERDVCTWAWHAILCYGVDGAEAAADRRIAELRADGAVAGAEMWQVVKARIPELLAHPEIWDDLPEPTVWC